MTMPRRGPNKVANREDSALVVATVACLPASWSPHPHPHPHAHPHSHPRPHLYPHADRRRGAAMNWEPMRMPSDHLKRSRRQEAGEDVAGCARMGWDGIGWNGMGWGWNWSIQTMEGAEHSQANEQRATTGNGADKQLIFISTTPSVYFYPLLFVCLCCSCCCSSPALLLSLSFSMRMRCSCSWSWSVEP